MQTPPATDVKRTVGRPRPPGDVWQRLEALNTFVSQLAPQERPDDDFVRKTVGRPRRR
jgi:hypothetical protein